jgi:predicted RNA-binding protein with PUA-like domain
MIRKPHLESPSGKYWLVKSEPETFSIDDLASAARKTTHWDGVRNYQARNMLRDEMRKGDYVLFYHSNAKPTAVVGIAQVTREGYPDFTAWDAGHPHFDPKSNAQQPTWYMVDIRLVERFAEPLTLDLLRQQPGLRDMVLLRKGSRLSVQPVSPQEFALIVGLSRK